jgi:hypothetical protein
MNEDEPTVRTIQAGVSTDESFKVTTVERDNGTTFTLRQLEHVDVTSAAHRPYLGHGDHVVTEIPKATRNFSADLLVKQQLHARRFGREAMQPRPCQPLRWSYL